MLAVSTVQYSVQSTRAEISLLDVKFHFWLCFSDVKFICLVFLLEISFHDLKFHFEVCSSYVEFTCLVLILFFIKNFLLEVKKFVFGLNN